MEPTRVTRSATDASDSIVERLKNVPLEPGVYLWKDAHGTILYVGKSKSLRDRMRSYFGSPKGLNGKTHRLVGQIADFDIIVTTSELEALLLEMNLIKAHRPRFNVLLKDDKTYPFIKITLQEAWPRVFSTRNRAEDGSRYFGPYASAGSVYRTLDLLNKLFAFRPPRDCRDDRFKRHQRLGKPCLYFDIKRCLGPCVPGVVSQDEYRAAIDGVVLFLEGKTETITRALRQKMEAAAEELNFERAAYIRDQIQAIQKVSERQHVLKTVETDQDVIAFAREDGSAVVQVFFIRGGKLIGAEPYTLQGAEDAPDQELLASFLTQFYDQAAEVPPNILLADQIEEPLIIEQWLRQKRGGQKVQLQVPRRGEKRDLVDLAAKNAAQKLSELRVQWLNSQQRSVAGLAELAELLGLSEVPMRIECYDISNTQGTNSVGSMVVFEQGKPKKSAYRRFKIKSVQGANDVASIQEVLRRRFKRADLALGAGLEPMNRSGAELPAEPSDEAVSLPGDESDHAQAEADAKGWGELPDLVLIDGGKGQLNGAVQVLSELGYDRLPVAGVVKGPKRDRFDLLLPDADELLLLGRTSPALGLVQQIDEEADRFAKVYHKKLRAKGAVRSLLDDIPGIGPRRKKALIKAFGSLDGIRQASVDEIAAVPGMTRKSAEELKALL
jgi:excinuclease ABC subunit C